MLKRRISCRCTSAEYLTDTDALGGWCWPKSVALLNSINSKRWKTDLSLYPWLAFGSLTSIHHNLFSENRAISLNRNSESPLPRDDLEWTWLSSTCPKFVLRANDVKLSRYWTRMDNQPNRQDCPLSLLDSCGMKISHWAHEFEGTMDDSRCATLNLAWCV